MKYSRSSEVFFDIYYVNTYLLSRINRFYSKRNGLSWKKVFYCCYRGIIKTFMVDLKAEPQGEGIVLDSKE